VASSAPLGGTLVQMDLRLLRCFVAVAEERHFGRAAKRLGLSQPAVSRIIRLLERQMEVSLLVRDRSRGVELTAAGRIVLGEGRHLVVRYQAMVDEAQLSG
jgi:DNA-binding transcriptional LysR family regulator